MPSFMGDSFKRVSAGPRFVYDHIVKGHPNPDQPMDFCNKFMMENLALVKVEMASKSVIRSVKDQRFNFVAKVSSLGKFIVYRELTFGES